MSEKSDSNQQIESINAEKLLLLSELQQLKTKQQQLKTKEQELKTKEQLFQLRECLLDAEDKQIQAKVQQIPTKLELELLKTKLELLKAPNPETLVDEITQVLNEFEQLKVKFEQKDANMTKHFFDFLNEAAWNENFLDKDHLTYISRFGNALVERELPLPLDLNKELLENPSELKKFLRLKQQEVTEATHKLSRMQQKILLKLLLEMYEHRKIQWKPGEWFGETAPSDRAAFSRSLKRLESRGLINRLSIDEKMETKRTTVVELTDLGYKVAKRLTRIELFSS